MFKRTIFGSLLFVIVFIGAALSFNFIQNRQRSKRAVEGYNPTMAKAYIVYEGEQVNSMLGYKRTIDTSLYRDSIVPIDSEKTVNIKLSDLVDDNADIKYELRSFRGDNLVEEGDFRFVTRDGDYNQYSTAFRMDLTPGTEYSLVIKAISDSETITYYTRVVKLEKNKLPDFLEFAKDFSNAIYEENKLANTQASSTDAVTTFNVSGEVAELKNKANQNGDSKVTASSTDAMVGFKDADIRRVFGSADAMSSEYNATKASEITSNGNPGYVTLSSSFEDAIFNGIRIDRFNDPVPKVREVTEDSALIELRYKAISVDGGVATTYAIAEYFDMEYDNGSASINVNDYRRYVSQDFTGDSVSTVQNSVCLGITADRNPKYLTNKNMHKVAFVADSSLWIYNNSDSIYSSVYGTSTDEAEEERTPQEGYGINLLNMDDEILDFVVYGRINEGPREGLNGIVLYEYNIKEATLKEVLFIDSDMYYETMKLSVGKMCYFDKANRTFYCMMGNKIYGIDIISGQTETIVENVTAGQILVSDDMKVIAYPNNIDPTKVTELTIHDFESGKETVLKRNGHKLRLIDLVGEDIIYGTSVDSNIGKAVDGTPEFLYDQLNIVDRKGNVLKNYEKKGFLVSDVTINKKNITLERVTRDKETGEQKEAEGDYISYKPKDNSDSIKTEVSDNSVGNQVLNLKFPASIYISQGNEEIFTKVSSATSDIDLSLKAEVDNDLIYLFEPSGLIGYEYSIGKAIRNVYENQGYVVSMDGNVLYRLKQMRPYRTVAQTFPYKAVDNETDTFAACNYMCMLAAGIQGDYDEIRAKNDWEGSFAMYSDNVKGMNISGVKLDTAIGYLSDGMPFAAKLGDYYVLVVSYNDDFIRYYDPLQDKEVKTQRHVFQVGVNKKGNEFYTYEK
ncbi:MAG: hypothetical protein IKS48_04810 [Eubacterium sp.]|nr:hypothetical protein [Eubacterium sp.]